MSECHFDANGIGCIVSGTSNNNDSHGSISCSSFNHNKVCGICIIDVNNGYTFSGCHVFDGGIKMTNSKGFLYTGGIISGQIINDSPRTNSLNMIQSNILISAYNLSIDNYTNLDLKNNRLIDGSDSSAFNN